MLSAYVVCRNDLPRYFVSYDLGLGLGLGSKYARVRVRVRVRVRHKSMDTVSILVQCIIDMYILPL